MPRGRKPGQYNAGSLGGWLSRAKCGESYWTEQNQRTADTTARRAGRSAQTRVYFALYPDTMEVIRLTRVTITGEELDK